MNIIENIKLMLASKRAILEDLETAQVDVENLTKALHIKKTDAHEFERHSNRYYNEWRREQRRTTNLVAENASLKGRIAQLESNMRSAV